MAKVDKKIEDLEIPEKNVKGKVISIAGIDEVKTRYGDNIRITLNVEVGGFVHKVSLITTKKTLERQVIHPRSNLYKILTKYGCKKIRDLVGKEVELELTNRGFYRIVT